VAPRWRLGLACVLAVTFAALAFAPSPDLRAVLATLTIWVFLLTLVAVKRSGPKVLAAG